MSTDNRSQTLREFVEFAVWIVVAIALWGAHVSIGLM